MHEWVGDLIRKLSGYSLNLNAFDWIHGLKLGLGLMNLPHHHESTSSSGSRCVVVVVAVN